MQFFAKTYTASVVQVQVFSIKYAQNLHLQLKFHSIVKMDTMFFKEPLEKNVL